MEYFENFHLYDKKIPTWYQQLTWLLLPGTLDSHGQGDPEHALRDPPLPDPRPVL